MLFKYLTIIFSFLTLVNCQKFIQFIDRTSQPIISKCQKRIFEYDCRDLDSINVTTIDLSKILMKLNEDERDNIFKLNFAFNEIKEIKNSKPDENSFLNHIVEINLNNNHISKLSEKPFENFYVLRKLDLNRNKLVEIEKTMFFNLSSLIHLDLSNNQLKKFDLSAFNNIPILKQLDLSGNAILFQNQFFNFTSDLLPKLEVLVLKNCGLINLNAIQFSQTLILNSLNIGMNLFDKIPNNQLMNLKKLKTLDISGNNKIYSLNKDDFFKLSTVEMLKITNMGKMKRIKEYTFSGLIKLRELICSFNPVLREVNEKAFMINKSSTNNQESQKYLTDLNTIELNNNIISRLSKNFFEIERLIKFDISNNPLRCNGNLNYLFKLMNTSILLNQEQTNCSAPARLSGQSFHTLKISGLKQFDSELFIDDEHQALFGLFCVILISFLVVCSICILKVIRFKEKAQNVSNRYYQLTGLRISPWNCFNCFGLIKAKGFYNKFNSQNVTTPMNWNLEEDQELESHN